MLIDKAEIERVKQANELVAFIRSRGIALKQRGKQLVGLCPFPRQFSFRTDPFFSKIELSIDPTPS